MNRRSLNKRKYLEQLDFNRHINKNLHKIMEYDE